MGDVDYVCGILKRYFYTSYLMTLCKHANGVGNIMKFDEYRIWFEISNL